MTTFFVTTGISLIESSRCWKGADRIAVGDEEEDVDGVKHRDLHRLGSAVVDGLKQVRERAIAHINRGGAADEVFRYECWADPLKHHLLPAELATLAVMAR